MLFSDVLIFRCCIHTVILPQEGEKHSFGIRTWYDHDVQGNKKKLPVTGKNYFRRE